MKAAILVDGAFFLNRIKRIYDIRTPQETAHILYNGCRALLRKGPNLENPKNLYRILFYDCPPIRKKDHNPISKKPVDYSKTEIFKFRMEFHTELITYRKLALRMGNLDGENAHWTIYQSTLKELFSRKRKFEELTENDVYLYHPQKGVDMRIGIDIASLSFKKLVDQIILISADSDFVPAAKLARREGIDFVLDPMESKIKEDLYEHIDGLFTEVWTKSLLPKKRKTKGST